jgi:hypothetical protein
MQPASAPAPAALTGDPVEQLAREVVRRNGYSGALLLIGDRMFTARNLAEAGAWKRVADWLLAHPEVAHA